MATASYDASIIQEFAQRLYNEAASIIFWSAFWGLVIVAGLCAGGAALANARDAMGIAAIIGGVVGAIIGFNHGTKRAFKLKLEAQIALCQVQIERNTRAART